MGGSGGGIEEGRVKIVVKKREDGSKNSSEEGRRQIGDIHSEWVSG